MDFDIRKVFVILAVAVLFSLFSYALFDAVYPSVKYDDYCDNKPYFNINNSKECEAHGGKWSSYENNDYQEPVKTIGEGYCNLQYYCSHDYDTARDKRNFYAFIVMSIIGAISILVGIYLPLTNPLNEWVGTGFMLGGLFNIFFGTASYYQDLGRILRPVVLFIELALVIFLTYKKLGSGVNQNLDKIKKKE